MPWLASAVDVELIACAQHLQHARSAAAHATLPAPTALAARSLSSSALQGAVDTGFIAKHEGQLLGTQAPPAAVAALAAVAFLRLAMAAAQVSTGDLRRAEPARAGASSPAAACPLAQHPALPLATPQERAGGGGGGALPGPWGQPSSFRLNHLFSCPVAFTHPLSGTEVWGARSSWAAAGLGWAGWGRSACERCVACL